MGSILLALEPGLELKGNCVCWLRPLQQQRWLQTRDVYAAGVLYVASAIQLALLPLASPYDKAPYLFGIFGLALLILAVQVHRKKLWAVWTTTFLCGALGLATGGWLLLVLNHGLISPLLFLLGPL